MSTIHKRLINLEERKAFRELVEFDRELASRSKPELEFFSVHGFFPENAGEEVPPAREFTVAGIRTIITAEKA